MNRFLRTGALTALSFTLAVVSLAPRPAVADEPGVARISVLQGDATVTRGDSQQTVAGAINAPLETSDYLSTGPSTYAEVQFDGMSMLRVAGDTQVRFANMDPIARQIQLAQGTAELGLVRGAQAATTIDTPSVSVSATQMGDYRVSVVSNGATWVTVRSGTASLITPHGTQTLYAGNTAIASGPASNPSVSYTSAPATDAFDAFNAMRNGVALAAYNASSPYLDPSIAGSTDFAQYGTWVNVAGYGNVWNPYQSSGWAPYRDGNWTWTSAYGWTWVGNEPWGWAPYHYGRWFYANNYGWCWYPPAYGVASVWQPALVGFLGFNIGGLNIGLSFGNLAWVPLAPFEPYYGWGGGWGGRGWNNGWGGGYNNVTYITNITNINNYYSNLKHGGATAPGYRGGHVYGTRPVAIDPGKRVSVIRGPIAIAPTHNDLAYNGHFARNPEPLSKAFASPRFESAVAAQHVVPFAAQVDRVKTLVSEPPHMIAGKDAPPVRTSEPLQETQTGRMPQTSDRGSPVATAPVQHAAGGAPVAVTSRSVESAPKASDPWSSFQHSRGTDGVVPAHTSVAPVAPVTGHTAPLSPEANRTQPGSVVTSRTQEAPHAQGAWATFDAARGTSGGVATSHSATYSAPRADATYAAPRYSQNDAAPAPRYNQSYSAPAPRYNQSYSAPVAPRYNQTYSAPATRDAQAYPSRYNPAYSAPAPHYASPGGYTAPRASSPGGYSAPRGGGGSQPRPSAPSSGGGGGHSGSGHRSGPPRS
ncbi:MAG: DUF6600 domain-containing protein [Vulcanimicrobiaceae bacterium]